MAGIGLVGSIASGASSVINGGASALGDANSVYTDAKLAGNTVSAQGGSGLSELTDANDAATASQVKMGVMAANEKMMTNRIDTLNGMFEDQNKSATSAISATFSAPKISF